MEGARYWTRHAAVNWCGLPLIYSPKLNSYQADSSPRKMPRFLLLRYKYCHADPRFGISNEEHAVSAPLRSANVAESIEYYMDTDSSGGFLGDLALVDLVNRVQPDAIILSSYNHLNYNHPHFGVLKAIRSKCHIPLVVIWHDSTMAMKPASYMLNDIDLHILYDSGALARQYPDRNNFLRLWAPLDFSVFRTGEGDRDLDVSFLGSTGSYRDVRVPYLDYLKKHNVNLFHSGGITEHMMSLESYAEILRRSKISLNFSYSVAGTSQLKARVFEILFSGALLLENANEETPAYFTPTVDYVAFDSKEDLLEKARYYLEHGEERAEIARNGHIKAITQFNHQTFWNKVMEKMTELKLL